MQGVSLVDHPLMARALSVMRSADTPRAAFRAAMADAAVMLAYEALRDDLPIIAAVLDRQLDERGFIRPGLGDAGDRIFGTD